MVVDEPWSNDLWLWTSPLCGLVPWPVDCSPMPAPGLSKLEGSGRPDGARRGIPEFFNLLNHAKECVEIDFANADERAFSTPLALRR